MNPERGHFKEYPLPIWPSRIGIRLSNMGAERWGGATPLERGGFSKGGQLP